MFNIVLVEPEIPPNTGNIVRTAAATDSTVYLVGKLGFKTDDKHLKRAGLDYWKHVNIKYVDNIDILIEKFGIEKFRFYSKKSDKLYTKAEYKPDDFLVFGRETYGLPDDLIDKYSENSYKIPTKNVRSLNLATSVGIVLFEALRENNFMF